MKEQRICLRFIGWFFLVNAIFFILIGSTYLRLMLQSTTLFHNLIADYSSWIGKTFVLVFTFSNFLSYMSMLAFIPAALIILLAFLFPKPRLIGLCSVMAATTAILLLVLDVQIYSMFKFHLNKTVFDFIWSQQAREVFDLSLNEQLIIAGIGSLVIALECFVAWCVWRYIVFPKRFNIGKQIALFWFGCALTSYMTVVLSISTQQNNLFIQQAANLPFYNVLLAHVIPDKEAKDVLKRYSEDHYMQAMFSQDRLHYPRHVMQCMPKNSSEKPLNIILIMVDSLRFDSLKYMPNLRKFAEKNMQFTRHISGGNSTQAGLFALFYSIPSNYWTAALEQHVSPVFIDLLLKYGYKTRVIWSGEMRNPPMNKTIYQKLSDIPLDGAPGNDVSEWDRDTTRKARRYLLTKTSAQPFFLNLFYNAPHAFCSSNYFPTVYKPSYKACSRIGMRNNLDPLPYYNSYLNTVHFIDLEFAKVLDVIEKKGYLDNSIVIFTSDHGQEFNENHQNYWGHASNYSDYQVHVPLIIHWPKQKARAMHYQTSGYDIIPTLLSRVFRCQNPFSDYSIGQDLFHASKPSFILAGSYVSSCIIEEDRLTTLHPSGDISITDKTLKPIDNAVPRKDVFNRALNLMRQFYLE